MFFKKFFVGVLLVCSFTNMVLMAEGSSDEVWKTDNVFGGEFYAVANKGNHAYVTTAHGLQVLDVSDGSNPFIVGKCYIKLDVGKDYQTHLKPKHHSLKVVGDYAYMLEGKGFLRIINIADPASPYLAGSISTLGAAYNLDISGDYVYIADGNGGLKVVDVSNPASPSMISSLDMHGNATDIVIEDDYAYLSVNSKGLYIVDIATPTSPREVGYYEDTATNYSVGVYGDYAYLGGNGISKLRIIDINDIM